MTLEELVEITKDIGPSPDDTIFISEEQAGFLREGIREVGTMPAEKASLFGLPVHVSKFIPEGKIGKIPKQAEMSRMSGLPVWNAKTHIPKEHL